MPILVTPISVDEFLERRRPIEVDLQRLMNEYIESNKGIRSAEDLFITLRPIDEVVLERIGIVPPKY